MLAGFVGKAGLVAFVLSTALQVAAAGVAAASVVDPPGDFSLPSKTRLSLEPVKDTKPTEQPSPVDACKHTCNTAWRGPTCLKPKKRSECQQRQILCDLNCENGFGPTPLPPAQPKPKS